MPATSEDLTHSFERQTPAFIASLIERAARNFDADRVTSRDCLLRAYTLLLTQTQHHPKELGCERGRLATWQTKRVLAYIDTHLNLSIRVSDLAELVDLSPSHFFRAFKISIGMPPCEYIARRRIYFACESMRISSEPLAQIALNYGFSEQSSFCRVFLRVMGATPGRWRRTHRGQPSDVRDAFTEFREA